METTELTADNDQPVAAKRSPVTSFTLLALVGIVGLMLWTRYAPVTSAVAWQTDYAAGLAAAAKAGKPVLLDFGAAGCVYCRQMEAEVLPQPEVLAEVAKFVPVKLDANAEADLAVKYDVYGLPAYIVAKASGEPVAAISGYQPADRFIKFLQLGEQAARAPAP